LENCNFNGVAVGKYDMATAFDPKIYVYEGAMK